MSSGSPDCVAVEDPRNCKTISGLVGLTIFMFYVYIIKSIRTNKHYIGQTNNLGRRIKDHNRGKDHSSKIGKPWVLIASKEFTTRKESINIERKIKNLKSRERINKFIAGWSSGSSSGS